METHKRIQEQLQYEIAKKWLNENGKFEIFPFKEKALFKAVFTDKKGITEQNGEDLIRLTIQIYNEVNN